MGELQPYRPWFHVLQLCQSVFGVASISIFALLVQRHSELRQRQFFLIKLIAASDFLFLFFLGPGVGLLPIIRARGANSECSLTGRICSTDPFCSFSAWWVSFTLLISLNSYALLAFERCWTICFAMTRGHLSGQLVLKLWFTGVALVAFVASVPFFMSDGGARVMPSGAYCLLRFDSFSVTAPVLAALTFLLVVVALCYAAVARVICHVGLQSSRGEVGREGHSNRELRIAAKLLMLTVVYVALWTPALVMIVKQARYKQNLKAASEPYVDLVAAICAALASSTSQVQNLLLFEPIRVALMAELRKCACLVPHGTAILRDLEAITTKFRNASPSVCGSESLAYTSGASGYPSRRNASPSACGSESVAYREGGPSHGSTAGFSGGRVSVPSRLSTDVHTESDRRGSRQPGVSVTISSVAAEL